MTDRVSRGIAFSVCRQPQREGNDAGLLVVDYLRLTTFPVPVLAPGL